MRLWNLERERNVELEGDVAAHVEYAHAARDRVHVGIFETAQVALVGLVEQVITDDADGGDVSVVDSVFNALVARFVVNQQFGMDMQRREEHHRQEHRQ